MNIDDVLIADIDIPEGNLLEHIFAHQTTLMEKYDDIERRNGVTVPSPPYSLDDKFVQHRIKDMFWRVTEELAEAFENIPNLLAWRTRWNEDADIRHFFEEIADALHFLVEASIISNFIPWIIEREDLWEKAVESSAQCQAALDEKEIREVGASVIYCMGLAANTLKNKPWKQTHMPTDYNKFEANLTAAWFCFLRLWRDFDGTLEELYVLYCRKKEVNKFRQRSNY